MLQKPENLTLKATTDVLWHKNKYILKSDAYSCKIILTIGMVGSWWRSKAKRNNLQSYPHFDTLLHKLNNPNCKLAHNMKITQCKLAYHMKSSQHRILSKLQKETWMADNEIKLELNWNK